jgi:hypothetical protein
MISAVSAVTSAKGAVQLRSIVSVTAWLPMAAPTAPSTTAVPRNPRIHQTAGITASPVWRPPSRPASTSRLIAVSNTPSPAPPFQLRPPQRPAVKPAANRHTTIATAAMIRSAAYPGGIAAI